MVAGTESFAGILQIGRRQNDTMRDLLELIALDDLDRRLAAIAEDFDAAEDAERHDAKFDLEDAEF